MTAHQTAASIINAAERSYPYPPRVRTLLSPFELLVLEVVETHGGLYNAHAHLDRAGTLDDIYLAHIGTTPLIASNLPLSVKQNAVGNLHTGPAYSRENLEWRMRDQIERQIALGVTRLCTNIDATPDLPEDGLLAINIVLKLKAEFAGRIAIEVAPTPIFGFKKDERDKRGRWEVFRDAARLCDIISLLPEKDDYPIGKPSDGRIGFKPHLRRGLDLALELGKPVEVHLNQGNIPGEGGTRRMLELLEAYADGMPKMPDGAPWVWVIHAISDSADPEPEFRRTLDLMSALNIGVKCCPSAGLSMRQLPSVLAPTHNSIARVLEMAKMRIPVLFGTDNIADLFVPMGDGDMLTEAMVASMALRLSSPNVLGKIAAGARLNNVDVNEVGQVIYENRKACAAANPKWVHATEM